MLPLVVFPLETPAIKWGLSKRGLGPKGANQAQKTADFFSQIHPFSWEFKHLEGAGNRRKPQILAENRTFLQKTAGNRRLGSVTLGPSPSAQPYFRVQFLLRSAPKSPNLKGPGGLFYLQLELFCLQLSFFAYSSLRPLLDALSHCKQKKAPIVSKEAKIVSKRAAIVSKKS